MIPAGCGLRRDRKRKPTHALPKREKKPEERPVTLCIAAECEHEGAPAIVMCCDWQSQTGNAVQGFVNADDAYKLREVKSASALLDGSPTMADALLASCRGAISEFIGSASGPDSDLATDRFLRNLEAGASSRKTAIIDHHVRMRLGMEYADLRRIPLTTLACLIHQG